MQIEINKTALLVIQTISYLYQTKQDINPNKVAKVANIDWKTAKKYMINNFNIKE